MLNVVPDLVLETYELGKEKTEFEAYSIFADISGFTKITEELSRSGKEGAEILTDIINSLFSPLINIIYDNGGFISTFAGDALTAIFPEGNKKKIQHITEKLAENFKKHSMVKTHLGNYEFFIKMGAGSGMVSLNIVEGKERTAFYFHGEAIKRAVNNEEKVKLSGYVLDGIADKIGPIKRSPIKTSPSTQYLFFPDIIVTGSAENSEALFQCLLIPLWRLFLMWSGLFLIMEEMHILIRWTSGIKASSFLLFLAPHTQGKMTLIMQLNFQGNL